MTDQPTPDRTTPWIKASASDTGTSCVEQRRNGEFIEIRDTKDHGDGPVLSLTPEAYESWLATAKTGVLDDLADSS